MGPCIPARPRPAQRRVCMHAIRPCMTGWDDLRFLLAVCRAGTLTGAARALGCSQPTVSRRMAALAARHGGALFETLSGRYVPTEVGRSLAERAERIEREIH